MKKNCRFLLGLVQTAVTFFVNSQSMEMISRFSRKLKTCARGCLPNQWSRDCGIRLGVATRCIWLTGTQSSQPFPGGFSKRRSSGLCHQPDAAPQPLAACVACGAPSGSRPRLLFQPNKTDRPSPCECQLTQGLPQNGGNSKVAYSRRLKVWICPCQKQGIPISSDSNPRFPMFHIL